MKAFVWIDVNQLNAKLLMLIIIVIFYDNIIVAKLIPSINNSQPKR